MKAAVGNAIYKWSKSATYRSVPVGANVLELRAFEFAKNDLMSVLTLYQVISSLQR